MGGVSMSYGEWCRRQVRVGSQLLDIPHQQHKMLVILLASHPDRWVQIEDFIDDLWCGARMPDSWHDVAQQYIQRMRERGIPIIGRLGRDGGYRIERRGRFTIGDQV